MIENKLIKVMDYFAPYFKSGKEDYNVKVFIEPDSYLLLDANKFHQALNSEKITKKPYGLGIQSYQKRIWVQHIENKCLRFWMTKENGGIKDTDKFYDLEFNEDINFKDIKFISTFYWKNNARHKDEINKSFWRPSSNLSKEED